MKKVLLGSFISIISLILLANEPIMLNKNEKPLVKSVETVLELPPTDNNPRNSEGAFITLKDGTIMYAFSRYHGGSWDDNAPSDIAARYSYDGGKTWTKEDKILFKCGTKTGDNLMSVSLLRLQNGEIAIVYLQKFVEPCGRINCMPKIRFSKDECKTWSEVVDCIPHSARGYYVVNNDRVIQLKNGRLLVPTCYAKQLPKGVSQRSIDFVYYSDDNGRTWKESEWLLPSTHKTSKGLQEPGLIELQNGNVMLFARTDLKYQYKSFSADKGETWSAPVQATEFPSPVAPLSIKRNPADNSLIAVWCGKQSGWNFPKPAKKTWGRTPLVMAVSYDDGNTWEKHTAIETDHTNGFCYTAIHFTDDNSMLLAYCCGGKNLVPLQAVRIKKFKLNK